MAAAAVPFGLLLGLVTTEWQPLQDVDAAVIDAVNQAVSGWQPVVTAARAITQLGGPIAVTLIVAVPAVWLVIRGLPRLAAYVAVTGLGAAVLGPGVKALVERARPLVDVPLSSPSGASFPSGHAVAVTIALGAVLLAFLPAVPPRGRWPVIAAVAAVVVLVGLTRVALGVHYPSDVVAGWLLGLAWLGLTAAAFRHARTGAPAAAHLSGVDAVTPHERHKLELAPAHERPLPDSWHTAARLVVGFVLLTGLTIGIGLLVTGPLEGVRRADRDVLDWFVAHRDAWPAEVVMWVGGVSGVSGSVAVLSIVIPITLALTRRWSPALFLLVAAAGQALVYLATSRLVDRERPGVERAGEAIGTFVSFPSGHVGAAVATYGGIALLVLTWVRRPARRWIVVPAAAMIVLVALQRLFRGFHFPTDVVAGAAYGFAWLVLCWIWLHPVPPRRADDG